MLHVFQKINLEVVRKNHVYMCRKREFIPFHFLENFDGHQSSLWGHWYPCFWTFNDICPGFQSQDGSPHLWASSPACNGFHRITFGVTLADLLAVSITAEPFFIRILAHVQAPVWDQACHCLTECDTVLNDQQFLNQFVRWLKDEWHVNSLKHTIHTVWLFQLIGCVGLVLLS